MVVWVAGEMISRYMLADGGLHDFSDLHLSFGLADATLVDSVNIYWPSGIVQELGSIEVNQFITIVEDENVGVSDNEIICYAPSTINPNPIRGIGSLVFSQNKKGMVNISFINSTGSIIKEVSNEFFEEGSHEIDIDVVGLQSGIYFVKIVSSYNTEVLRVVVM